MREVKPCPFCGSNGYEITEDLLNTRIRALESDGSHTFAELYHHRAVLFSVVTNDHLGISWKSRLHEDGTMFDGYFIVGILTPEGMFSYHYEMKEWDLFECKELPRAPKWDGHTPDDVWRLSSLARASWNTRPIEDALNKRIAELEAIADKLAAALTYTYNRLPTHWRGVDWCPYSYSDLMVELRKLKEVQ